MVKSKKTVKIALSTAAAAILIAAVCYALWRGGCFLPDWISWQEKDGSGIELKDRRVRCGAWESPKGSLVQDYLYCDIDRDEEEELMLLVWKIGRFGEDRPFWVTHDEHSWSQHIFIYDRTDDGFRPAWMASDIGVDAASWDFHEERRLIIREPDGSESTWDWQGFGLRQRDFMTFACFGDNLIHEPLYRYGLRTGSFDYLYEGVSEQIEEADLSVLNQETVLVKDHALYGDFPRFGSPVGVGEAIAGAGLDVVTLANNHILDRSDEGIRDTLDFYASTGVCTVGISEDGAPSYRILERQGIRIALFNYTFGTNGLIEDEESPYRISRLDDEDRIREELEDGIGKSDISIVFVHWGTEYEAEPDGDQRHWAEFFCSCGVDTVVGTHPHVLQPMEILESEGHQTVVYYSIGNYISAQTPEECRHGGIALFHVLIGLDGCRITNPEIVPLVTEHDSNGKYTTHTETQKQTGDR